MTSDVLLTKAGRKLFEKHLGEYAPADPLYEFYTDERGRKKRRKRQLPPGLSTRDAKILQSVKKRAHYLDKGFRICGMRFGWTFVIGLIPGAGDVADAFLNYFLVLRKARQADLPGWLIRRMLINNMVSACVGLVPLVGDIVLAQYKANSRNAALLEEFLRIRGEELFKVEQDAGGQGSITKVGKTRDANGAPTAATQGATKTDGEETRPALGIDRRENDQTEVSIPAKKKTIASWFGKSTSIDKGKFVEDVNSGSGSGSDDKRD